MSPKRLTIVFQQDPSFYLLQLVPALNECPDYDCLRKRTHPDGELTVFEASAGGYYWDIDPNYYCGVQENGDGKILSLLTTRLLHGAWYTHGHQDTPTRLMVDWHIEPYLKERVVPADPGDPERKRPPREEQRYLEPVVKAVVKLPSGEGVGYSEMPGTALLVAYLTAWGVLEATYPDGFLAGLQKPNPEGK